MLNIRDMAKSNTDSKKCQQMSTNKNDIDKQMKDIVSSYNQSFISKNTTFDIKKTASTNKKIQMSRSKKRLKPNHEIIRQVRKQPKAIRNCSFCKGINHRKTNCPKLGEYRARYKEIFDNQHHEYIEFLKQTAPIMHPNDTITVYSEVLSKIINII